MAESGKVTGVGGVALRETVLSWFGAFLGISCIAFADFRFLGQSDLALMIGSFGASAVLIYGAVESPLAQPRNVLGGHVLSAMIGVAAYQLLGQCSWLAAALAVASAVAAMQITRTLHPPGGATALIAVTGSQTIHDAGYLYALIPVGLGATILLVVALAVNNVTGTRRYPHSWW